MPALKFQIHEICNIDSETAEIYIAYIKKKETLNFGRGRRTLL